MQRGCLFIKRPWIWRLGFWENSLIFSYRSEKMDIKICTDRGKINSTPELSYKRHRRWVTVRGLKAVTPSCTTIASTEEAERCLENTSQFGYPQTSCFNWNIIREQEHCTVSVGHSKHAISVNICCLWRVKEWMKKTEKPFPDLSFLVAQESELEIRYCRLFVTRLFIHQIITTCETFC